MLGGLARAIRNAIARSSKGENPKSKTKPPCEDYAKPHLKPRSSDHLFSRIVKLETEIETPDEARHLAPAKRLRNTRDCRPLTVGPSIHPATSALDANPECQRFAQQMVVPAGTARQPKLGQLPAPRTNTAARPESPATKSKAVDQLKSRLLFGRRKPRYGGSLTHLTAGPPHPLPLYSQCTHRRAHGITV
jgi:hypothetical protein